MTDFAPGLPDKNAYAPITNSRGITRLVFQRHKATSDHYDMRLLEGDKLHSWVTRKLPGEADKILMIQQPTHRSDYIDFEGEIKAGYGKGTVKKVYDKPVDVLNANNERLHFVTDEGEFNAIHVKDKNWLLVRNTNTIPGATTTKPPLKDVDISALNANDNDTVWQPKVDGGHTIFRLHSDKINRIHSYQTSAKDGKVIEHTHQVPHLRDAKVPKDLDGVEIRGELYARNQGDGPLPAEEIGGMLNSNIFKSREKQALRGRLQSYAFKIKTWKNGEDVENAPYSRQLQMLDELSKKVPEFPAPETAHTASEKQSLLNRISGKTHPDTVEGIVEWHLHKPGGDPRKAKIFDKHEVVIRNIFKADSKTPMAGGFEYSWTKDGPVVGRVGTGFSAVERKRMFTHPHEFVGKIARVQSQQIFASGAMRAPSYYGLHVEKNLDKKASVKDETLRDGDRMSSIENLYNNVNMASGNIKVLPQSKEEIVKEKEFGKIGMVMDVMMKYAEANMKTLKKYKVDLTPEERSQVMSADAVWNHGPNGEATPAVWKAVINGKTTYVTNTHRAYNTADTVKGAISRYHKFIKGTA